MKERKDSFLTAATVTTRGHDINYKINSLNLSPIGYTGRILPYIQKNPTIIVVKKDKYLLFDFRKGADSAYATF